MKKVISNDSKLHFTDIENVRYENIYMFADANGSIFKATPLQYIRPRKIGFGFIELNKTFRFPFYTGQSLKDTIERAIRAGMEVYELEDMYELVKFLNNEINKII